MITRTVIAWGVFEICKNGVIRLPPIGNGKQFQYPIFYRKCEAIDYSKEYHGLNKQLIKKVFIK